MTTATYTINLTGPSLALICSGDHCSWRSQRVTTDANNGHDSNLVGLGRFADPHARCSAFTAR